VSDAQDWDVVVVLERAAHIGGGHRLPVDGLYQTGSTTHPGAGVTGAPGRNCARVVLGDLGLTFGRQ
jgi:phytoene dehydrogenase-like protein